MVKIGHKRAKNPHCVQHSSASRLLSELRDHFKNRIRMMRDERTSPRKFLRQDFAAVFRPVHFVLVLQKMHKTFVKLMTWLHCVTEEIEKLLNHE